MDHWFREPTAAITDARWFAVDLHVPEQRFGFLRIDESVLANSTFMDTRISAPWEQSVSVPACELEIEMPIAHSAAFLFHTSFCGSTLLARALHQPPFAVALKEPLLLRRLADARFHSWPVGHLLPTAARLLARPWHAGGAVLIQPTHVALSLGNELLAAIPTARGIVLTSSLEDFLLSHLKKQASTQAKVPELVERAMSATSFLGRLGAEAFAPPNFLAAVALQWCAQREVVGELVATDRSEQLRLLDQTELLADLPGVALACARWLRWPSPEAALLQTVAEIRERNAKEPGLRFDADIRHQQRSYLKQQFQPAVNAALAWAERVLFPAMQSAPILAGRRLLI
jgi:hypothetical protein